MEEKRDEFEELIRSFSMDRQSAPQGTPQRARGMSGTPSGMPPRGAAPSGRFSPSGFESQPPRTGARNPAGGQRFPSSGFEAPPSRTPPPQPYSSAPSRAYPPNTGYPQSATTTGVTPAGVTPVGAGRFSPSGFETQGGLVPSGQQPVPTSSVSQPRNFQVRINEEDYAASPGVTFRTASAGAPGGSGGGRVPPARTVESGTSRPPEKKRKRKKRGGGVLRFFEALIIAGALVACSIFLSIFALQSMNDFLGMNKEEHTASFTLKGNPTMKELAAQLEQAGIITQPLTFQIYGALTRKEDEKFEEGTYELSSKMAYSQLLEKFSRGNKAEKETVRITFPEGRTIVQIAEELEKNGVCTAEEFYEAADTGSYGYEFEDSIPDNPLRFHRLEGYIFPDTYDFYVPEPAESVVAKFLKAFNANVTQDLYLAMEHRGMTLDQTIALASVIQKEAGDVELMYDVSSVFHNRLTAGMRLESDATSDYIKNQMMPNLSSPDQSMFDAYDTYVCDGIPVGPINNPGMNAINAAIDPVETPYYFFLSDQKGEYHFSETLAQHQAFMTDAGDAHGTATGHDDLEGAGTPGEVPGEAQ